MPWPNWCASAESVNLRISSSSLTTTPMRRSARRAESALRAQGCDVLTVVLQGDEIGADARSAFQVLLALDRVPRIFIGVGSGTITDVARVISHRIGSEFISLPTAASVDGFTSIGAPTVIDGAKITVNAHGPMAVFADLPTLCAAPQPLIAAGFGDLLAKLTSTADWELGASLWDEPYDAEIARRSRAAALACAARADAVAAASEDGVRDLFDGLIESGFCMLDFGETRPASGYEHHISHFWEMKLLREGRHAVLHGAKVGVAVRISAKRYDAIRAMSRAEAADRLAHFAPPPRAAQEQVIRDAYGRIADQIIPIQAPFLNLTRADFERLAGRSSPSGMPSSRSWRPSRPTARSWGGCAAAGGPVTGAEIGLSDAEVAQGIACGHYYRNRFTIGKLSWMLGIGGV